MQIGKDRFVLSSRAVISDSFGIDIPKTNRKSESFSVEVVRGLSGLKAIRRDWEQLVQSDSMASPYASWNWIESWIEVFGQGQEFLTMVCYQGYDIVGIVPFVWKARTSPLEIRKIWMLGFHSFVGTNGLTEEPIFAIASDSKIRDRVWTMVHDELQRLIDRGRWDSAAYRKFGLGFEDLSIEEVGEEKIEVQKYWRGCEYVSLPETWEQYLKTISKSMRENIPYYHKKFVKEGIEYSIDVVEPERVEEVVSTLITLHKKRTYADSSMQHVDYFGDERQQNLLKNATKKMVAAREARVISLTANGEIIAAQVFLQNENMILAHYSGFDPEWSKFSPLFVLQTKVIKDAIQEGYRTFNLLRGNANWQRRWGADSHNQIVDVTISRRTFVPRLRQMLGHKEEVIISGVSNAHPVRKARAAYRTWQLAKKSA